MDERLEGARKALRHAHSIAVLTGAGISAESGIPTFRGPDSLWQNYRPEELATPQAFARNPQLVWEWYDWRRGLIAAAAPNPGHHALVTLAERAQELTLITQNVDGLHDRAGSSGVLKVHGDIWDLRCMNCRRVVRDTRVPLPELPPRCACGGMLRPGVVWFGESLPQDVWAAAETAVSRSDVFLVVGTSAVVYPAAGLIDLARDSGVVVIEVNIADTTYSRSVDFALHGPSAAVLPALL